MTPDAHRPAFSGGVPTDRAIAVEGLRNLRGLGGLPAAGGRTIRPGILFRSEAPVDLPSAGREALAALGLRTIVDVRSKAHTEYVPAHLPEGVRHVSFVITPPADGRGVGLIEQVMAGELRKYTPAELADLYVSFLDEQAPAFGAVIEHLAAAENLPCLVHCHAGKDRTGLIIAMALKLAGVSRAIVIEDFKATSYYRGYRRAEVEPTLIAHGIPWEDVSTLFTAPAEVLERALDYMGSARTYLHERGGVSSEALDRLSELLVA